jgi:hypothetical protein
LFPSLPSTQISTLVLLFESLSEHLFGTPVLIHLFAGKKAVCIGVRVVFGDDLISARITDFHAHFYRTSIQFISVHKFQERKQNRADLLTKMGSLEVVAGSR